MSTRSRIAIQNKDKSIRSIYCHHDGYLSYLGDMLHTHYQNKDKVNELMELGSISSLGETTERKITRAYGRELNSYQNPLESTDFQDLWSYYENEGWDEEYLYLFKNNKWYYVKSKSNLIPLSKLV